MPKSTNFFILITFLATSLLAQTTATSTSKDNIGQKLFIPNEKYVLPNGLEVILSEDHSTPFVAINLWYQVGAVNEKINKTGLAHLFEHLMFEGSRHVQAGDHFRLLENAGAFDVNASTSFDRTNYYQTVPKNQLELALSLESSRMAFLVIDQNKLDEQRAVVRREREQRFEVAPYGLATLRLWQEIFSKNHPFFGRVIGSHEDLEAAKLEDVQTFYDLHYEPSNAALTLVGDFDKNEAKILINKYFGPLPSIKTPKLPTLPKVVMRKEEIIRVEEKIAKLPLIRIQYITPALFQLGDAEMDVIAHILAGGEYGRLTKAITRDQQLASSISAHQQSFEQLSVFTIDAMLLPSVKEEQVVQEIDRVLADLVNQPIAKVEIDRGINSILTNQFFALQDLGGYAGRAELLQSYNRFAKDPNFIQQDIMRYQKLDENALKSAAKTYLPVGKARKILIAKPTLNHVATKDI